MRTLTLSIVAGLFIIALAFGTQVHPLTPYQNVVNEKLNLDGVTGYHPIGEDGFWIQYGDGYHLEIYDRGMDFPLIVGKKHD